MDKTESTFYQPPEDRSSLLDSINPEADIDKIMTNLLGIKVMPKIEKGQKIYFSRRVSKPEFSEEYIRDLTSDLARFLNFTVQVSRFEQKKINKKVGSYLLALGQDFATHGDDNYVSDDTWQKILDIHDQKFIVNNEEKSGWVQFGINWSYNQPVTFDMIRLVKDFDEEKDQSVKFSKHIATFGTIIEASLNKSFSKDFAENGMIARLLGEVRTESTTLRHEEQKQNPFSFMKPKSNKDNQIEW